MAKIIKRAWSSTGPLGRKVKNVAYGYTLMVNGRQERKVSSAWLTDMDALEALAQRQREVGAGQVERVERTSARWPRSISATRSTTASAPSRAIGGSWRAGSCRRSGPCAHSAR